MGETITLTKKEDWQECLRSEIAASIRKPFKWGEHDCATFAADCVLAMSGVDVIAEYRGTYESEDAALFAGGAERCLADAMALFEVPEIKPNEAAFGDVVLVENGGKPACAICLGARVAYPGRVGLRERPREIKKAYRIS